jgi:hypothetical protein
MNDIQEKVLGWAQALGTFFRPDPFIVSDVPEKLGTREEVAPAVDGLYEAGHLQSEESIPGIYWARRPVGLPVEMSRPSLESIAKAIARQRGAQLTVGEGYARGLLGLEDRHGDEAPMVVAMSGIDETMLFGRRDDKPVIVAEPAPDWVFGFEVAFSELIAQGTRRAIEENRQDLIDRVVNHLPFGLAPYNLIDQAELARIELPDACNAIVDRMLHVAKMHLEEKVAVPLSRPKTWMPPEDFDGPVVAGQWQLSSFKRDGVIYKVLHGGDLFNHPDMPTASRNWRSSPIVWLDTDGGWAQSFSRLYKLLPQQVSSETRS